jgi:hypothetical protein
MVGSSTVDEAVEHAFATYPKVHPSTPHSQLVSEIVSAWLTAGTRLGAKATPEQRGQLAHAFFNRLKQILGESKVAELHDAIVEEL